MAAGAAVVLVLGTAVAGLAMVGGGSTTPVQPAASGQHVRPAPAPAPAKVAMPKVAPTPSTGPTAAPPQGALPTNLPMAGCPPPPYNGPPASPPWHPAHLVPDDQLPPIPTPPPGGRNPTTAISGKGMWIWQQAATDGGDARAAVADARRAGLHQLWVRVGDSADGFYGAAWLEQLVPAAHAAGLSVIGWGFPYLFDPSYDASWTGAVIGWRSSSGEHLDGYSADIEMASEGVALSPQRVAVYLGTVRQAAPRELLVATVYWPADQNMVTYPYSTMAPYIDAYAPMVYWNCVQPVLAVRTTLSRLTALAPVHVIGQAYDMGPYGGRRGEPPPEEIDAFMAAARQGGALGASFWSWQAMDPAEWQALSAFRW